MELINLFGLIALGCAVYFIVQYYRHERDLEKVISENNQSEFSKPFYLEGQSLKKQFAIKALIFAIIVVGIFLWLLFFR